MYKSFSPRLLVAAIALSAGLAANAFAAPGTDRPAPAGPRFEHPQLFHGRAMTRLHDELKLDGKQEVLWKEAAQFSKDSGTATRDRMRAEHDEIKTMLDKPGADLRAIAKRMDDLRAEGHQHMTEMRDRWLTVYDALNAEQKEKVRLFFKTNLERMPHQGPRPGQGPSPKAPTPPAQPAPAAK